MAPYPLRCAPASSTPAAHHPLGLMSSGPDCISNFHPGAAPASLKCVGGGETQAGRMKLDGDASCPHDRRVNRPCAASLHALPMADSFSGPAMDPCVDLWWIYAWDTWSSV